MDSDGQTETPPGVNLTALATYLQSAAPDYAGRHLSAELIAGGRSNLTYFIRVDDQEFVLRRPPLGHVLETAHDMSREFRVISALHGTEVPVATPIAFCEDAEVIGAPFYLMQRVDGQVLRTKDEAMAIGSEHIPGLSFRLVDTLGRLHATDPREVGLADFGKPDGFLERQVARWSKQLAASRSREVDGIDELAQRLGRRLPTTQRSAVVHGDYRLDNVIVAPNEQGMWGVAAVVDWEMSTLGDPLTDIGLFCTYWAGLGSTTLVPIDADTDAPAPFPPTSELINSYAVASGLDLEPLAWYVAFGCFKLAVILEGIHYRYSLGKTVGAGFDEIGGMVKPLVDRGLSKLNEG